MPVFSHDYCCTCFRPLHRKADKTLYLPFWQSLCRILEAAWNFVGIDRCLWYTNELNHAREHRHLQGTKLLSTAFDYFENRLMLLGITDF